MTIGVAVMTEEVVTIGVAVMIEEVVTIGVAVTVDLEMTGTEVAPTIEEITEGQTKTHIPETIGFVENVEIPTSHSELNAIAAVPQKEEEGVLRRNGKEMTVEQAIEERLHSQELVIGNALNAENPTSQSETNVSVVDVRRESVGPKEGVIIEN